MPACASPPPLDPSPPLAHAHSSPHPPRTDDLALITGLQQDLVQARFTNDGVAELLGDEAVAALDREQIVPGQLKVLRTLNDEGAGAPDRTAAAKTSAQACAVLTGLWLVAVEVTAEQVDEALPRTGVAGLQKLGLAEARPLTGSQQGGEVVVAARADLRPYQVEGPDGSSDLWVASDLSAHQVPGALPPDHVLGVGQASLTLAGSTHRRPAAAALDIGTGCGIQLLHLLAHCDHVTGTDISSRALEFARFNLLLNAAALSLDPERLEERVQLLEGSLLDPVVGRTFDMVVSNPPFVITPRTDSESEEERYTYRDGGREGDGLMAELISSLPALLNPGGTAQMLGNWEKHQQDQDWRTRPRRWVADSGLSAWFIQRDSQTPEQYAETWLRDASQERGVEDYRRRYAEYLADFGSRGVEQIGFGLIWLQASEAQTEPWTRFEEILGSVQQPLGPVLGETAHRAGRSLSHSLDQQLVVPESVTEERYQRFGAEHPEVIIARQGGGLRRSRPISSSAAGFLGAADGEFTGAQLVTAVCSLTGADEAAVSQEIRDLYIEGYLEERTPEGAGPTG